MSKTPTLRYPPPCTLSDHDRHHTASYHPFWRQVVVDLSRYGQVQIVRDKNRVVFEANSELATGCPMASEFRRGAHRWREHVTTANARGWDWSGDTEVLAYRVAVTEETLLEDVCVAFFVGLTSFMGWSSISLDYLTEDPEHALPSWRAFFDEAVRGEHDIKSPSGSPDRVLTVINDGNDRVMVAAGRGVVWLVHYMTS